MSDTTPSVVANAHGGCKKSGHLHLFIFGNTLKTTASRAYSRCPGCGKREFRNRQQL